MHVNSSTELNRVETSFNTLTLSNKRVNLVPISENNKNLDFCANFVHSK